MENQSLYQTNTLKRVFMRINPFKTHSSLCKAVALALPIALTGCSAPLFNTGTSGNGQYDVSKHKVDDYSWARCDDNIWLYQGDATNANALYWLRLMDCVQTISPAQARIDSYHYGNAKWDSVLKRSILLSRVDTPSTNAERRTALTQLKDLYKQYPPNLTTLIHLWHNEQSLALSFSQERSRNQRLKETGNSQVELLRAQLRETNRQLSETTRKLENLTNIERQLSTRKTTQNEVIARESNSDNVEATIDSPQIEQ